MSVLKNTKPLTIILPCAGEGTRLGLPYPKELYEIAKDFRLIDFSLTHIKKYIDKANNTNNKNIKVVVVINEKKREVYEYIALSLKSRGIESIPVNFNDNYFEWAGSVFSANRYFTEKNIVLLPDSVITLSNDSPFYSKDKTLIGLCDNYLQNNSVVFGTIFCDDKAKLKKLGACFVKDGRILKFQDKPQRNLQNFNAFWGCYAFKQDISKKLYTFLKNSILKRFRGYQKEHLLPFYSFDIANYWDLGTWDSINDFKTKGSLVLDKFLRCHQP